MPLGQPLVRATNHAWGTRVLYNNKKAMHVVMAWVWFVVGCLLWM
jgi:hypothetical protein